MSRDGSIVLSTHLVALLKSFAAEDAAYKLGNDIGFNMTALIIDILK